MAEIIRRIRAVDLPLAVDIVAVDDGSSDGTDKVLAALADSTVRVIDAPGQPGKGAAIRTGLESARGDLLAHPGRRPRVRPRGLAQTARPDPAGARPGSSTAAGSPASARTCSRSHWIGNRFLSLVTNILYRSTLSDMETCYKLFDRRGPRRASPGPTASTSNRRSRPRSCAAGYRIYEVPISYAGREVSEGKKITWRDGFGAHAALDRSGSSGSIREPVARRAG